MARLVRVLYFYVVGPLVGVIASSYGVLVWAPTFFVWATLPVVWFTPFLWDPIPSVQTIPVTRREKLWIFAVLIILQWVGFVACLAPYLSYDLMAGGTATAGLTASAMLLLSIALASLFVDDNRMSLLKLGALYRWVCVQPSVGSDLGGLFKWYCLATDGALWQEVPGIEVVANQIALLGARPGFRAPDVACIEHGVHMFVERPFGYTRLACGSLLLALLTPQECKALLAHELAHLAQPRPLREAIGRLLTDIIDLHKMRVRKTFRAIRRGPLPFLAGLLPVLVLYLWTQFLTFFLAFTALLVPTDARQVEREEDEADALAAGATSNEHLAAALIKYAYANAVWADYVPKSYIHVLFGATLIDFDERNDINKYAVHVAVDTFRKCCVKLAEYHNEDTLLIASGRSLDESWNEHNGPHRAAVLFNLLKESPEIRYGPTQDLHATTYYRNICEGGSLGEGFRSRLARLVPRSELRVRFDQPAVLSQDSTVKLLRQISKCATSRSPLEVSDHLDQIFKALPALKKA
jgi:Zn-dependent protease with chaperone function